MKLIKLMVFFMFKPVAGDLMMGIIAIFVNYSLMTENYLQ
jgi:hypothetical protein